MVPIRGAEAVAVLQCIDCLIHSDCATIYQECQGKNMQARETLIGFEGAA